MRLMRTMRVMRDEGQHRPVCWKPMRRRRMVRIMRMMRVMRTMRVMRLIN